MARLKSLLDVEQWKFFDALAPVARRQSFVVMPQVRLQHWLGQRFSPSLLNSALQATAVTSPLQSLRRDFRLAKEFFMVQSVLFSLIRVDVEPAILCFAVCNNEFTVSLLRAAGVRVISWGEILSGAIAPEEVISMASQACASSDSVPVELHSEEAILLSELSSNLGLAWSEEADRNEPDGELRKIIDQIIGEQTRCLAIFNEVAISKFIEIKGEIPEAERNILKTSSVDILVHARFPHNRPILVIEYDGLQHRNNPRKMANDEAKDALFDRAGIALLRIPSNEARARSYTDPYSQNVHPVHPRLPYLLRIARAIVWDEVEELDRRKEFTRLAGDEWSNISALARAMFGKNLSQLGSEKIQQAIGSTRPPEGFESDAISMEWQIEDLIDREYRQSWQWHLSDAGVPKDVVVDNVEVEKHSYGWVAKTLMRHPERGTKIRVSTQPILLRAPNLNRDEVERLVIEELYADLANRIRLMLDRSA